MKNKIISQTVFNHPAFKYGLLVIGIAVLELLHFWVLPQSAIRKVISPVQNLEIKIASQFKQGFDRWRYLRNSARRVQDLERQLAQSQALSARIHTLEEENLALKEKLKTVDLDQNKVLSFIISSFSRPAIAAGKAQGIKLGDPVLIDNNLIGVIDQVEQDYAFIRLLKDFTDRAVLVKTAGGIEAILRGDGRRIVVAEIAMTQKLDLRDQVMTVGQPGIPKGLAVGYIKEIKKQATDLEQQAILEQNVDFYQSHLVEIIMSGQ